MRALAAQVYTYLCRIKLGNAQLCRNSSPFRPKDELSIEEEAERKVGWLLNLIFAGTATTVAYQLFPYMDERRKKIIEMGGAEELVNILNVAKDDRTRKAALKALSALSASEEARVALHQAGAIPVIRSVLDLVDDQDIARYKLTLLRRFEERENR